MIGDTQERAAVSIVIPVFNHWSVTERCLDSLQRSARSSSITAEILLADDASTDATSTAWTKYASAPWPVRHLRSERNRGFLGNCNWAAESAAGTYLCLLNNDVVVQPGWLDRLVETLEREPRAGAVGPMFLAPNGTILECGAVVHSDGSARQLGWGADPDDPRYAFVNDVDYVSGACLLLRTQTYRELSGFDERYIPAYYEDTDLCLRLAEMGLRVLVNPAARMTHYEGSSTAELGIKRFQEVNRTKFHDRWADRLHERHPEARQPEDSVRVWRRGPTIAFYYPRPLTFDMDSGALRLLRLMLELRRRGHHVVLVSQEHDTHRLAILHEAGIETEAISWGGDPRHLQWLSDAPPRAAVFSHVPSEERFAKSYFEVAPRTIRLFDTVDLHFLREARARALERAETEITLPRARELDATGLDELAAAKRSDVTLVVSDFERDLLVGSFAWDQRRIRVVSNVHVPESTFDPFESRAGFIFLAGFAHPPNVDAALWITSSIWPLVRRLLPDAALDIYGSGMPAEILALDSAAAGIRVVGYAPDHRSVLAQARVMLAPLRYGAGVKGKIGEALAVGTPVVTNAIGAEGMDDEGLVLAIGQSPEAIAQKAVDVYQDVAEWTRRSAAGADLLRRRFSAEANVDELLAAIGDADHMRDSDSAYELETRLLWHELGHPGKPYSLRMDLDSRRSIRGVLSLGTRAWRFYRAHGLRAFVRRARDEVEFRRKRAADR